VRGVIADNVLQERVSLAEVYRVERSAASIRVVPVVDMAAAVLRAITRLSRRRRSRSEPRWMYRGASGRAAPGWRQPDSIGGANPLGSDAPVHGVIIASEYLTSEFASRARR